MATNRKRTPRSRLVSSLTPGEINYLYDRNDPSKDVWDDIVWWSKPERKGLWISNRDEVMDWWLGNKPCTRPGPWWDHESPRQTIGDFPPDVWDFPATRQRLGGIGTPCYEVLAYLPAFTLGIPNSWVEQWSVDYYNGRAKDIHGKPIGNKKEGDFKGVAVDPNDPPRYESQAAYLKRNGLLTAEEKAYLAKHPALLKPERVEIEATRID